MKKTILSFDVGIKNLAYCLIEKNDDNFKILKWDIINLVDDIQKCMNVTNKSCDQIAKFTITNKMNINEDNIMHVCAKHKIKNTPIMQDIKKKVKYNCIIEKCEKIAIKELSIDNKDNKICYCEDHVEKYFKQIDKKISIKKIAGTNSNKQPIQNLCEKLFMKLDKEIKFLDADEILIENQPSLRNPTMKTISSFLFSYFVLRGIVDKVKTNSNINFIKFISPSNKLKINKETTNKIINKENTKDKEKDTKEKSKTYKLTKNLGVKYCVSLISDEDKIILNKYKKKDDLCDSFLQGFQYLFSPVPDKYKTILEKIQ